MALINCPECGKEISSTVKICPNCGYTINTNHFFLPNISIKKSFKIIIISALFILLFVLYWTNKQSTSHTPFEVLYIGQTRDDVNKKLGIPNTSANNKENIFGYICNYDEYSTSFLNRTGNLTIWYDENNALDHAYFYVNYDWRLIVDKQTGLEFIVEPTSKDKDDMREYYLKIVSFYTEKYGTSERNEYYDHEWILPDNSVISTKFTLNPESVESAITVYYRWRN